MPEGPEEDLHDLIRERFESRREILEALSELDNELSEDAEHILQILEGRQE